MSQTCLVDLLPECITGESENTQNATFKTLNHTILASPASPGLVCWLISRPYSIWVEIYQPYKAQKPQDKLEVMLCNKWSCWFPPKPQWNINRDITFYILRLCFPSHKRRSVTPLVWEIATPQCVIADVCYNPAEQTHQQITSYQQHLYRNHNLKPQNTMQYVRANKR